MRRRLALVALASVVVVFVGAAASAQRSRHNTGTSPLPPVPATTNPTASSTEAGPPGDTSPSDPQSLHTGDGSYSVISEDVTLVDESRPGPDRGQVPTEKNRRLRTIIRRPEGERGRAPLIVFAHGYDTEPETYEPLLDLWASAGYVVAAPELPGSASDLPGTPQRDIGDQARDLSFVAGALLDRYSAIIDRTRVVAAGHSDGGSAVATVALNSAYTDSTFTAYVVLSGAMPDQVPDGAWGSGQADRALLVTVGDNDEYDNLSAAQSLYDSTTLPAALVVVPGGDHLAMYIDESPAAMAVRAMTVQFLDTVCNPSPDPVSWHALADNNEHFHIQTRARYESPS